MVVHVVGINWSKGACLQPPATLGGQAVRVLEGFETLSYRCLTGLELYPRVLERFRPLYLLY